jgi:hypothetical protein
MKLEQIVSSVDAGRTVFWRHHTYRVVKAPDTDTYLVCHDSGQCFALTAPDGKTLFFNEVDFAFS